MGDNFREEWVEKMEKAIGWTFSKNDGDFGFSQKISI